MPKISVIVPIYNVEQYLDRCLESLQRQSLRDIQIILVNDGSKDRSVKLCRRYERSDSRIVIVDKSNGGVSSARNAGLEVAEGKYVGFVDPDDWIEPDMYEQLYSTIATTNTDVCMCNYILENGFDATPVVLPVKTDLLDSKNDIVEKLICNMVFGPTLNSGSETIGGCVWRLLIRRSIIETNNIRFPEDISVGEDLFFSIQTLLASSSVSINRGCYYHYLRREGSATNRYRGDFGGFKLYDALYDMLKHELSKYPQLKQRMDYRYVNTVLSLVMNELHRDNRKNLVGKLGTIDYLCNDKRLRYILGELDMTGYTLRKKMVLHSLKYGWSLFLFVYYGILTRLLDSPDLLRFFPLRRIRKRVLSG